MTKEQLHKIIFDNVQHVLGGAPGLSPLTRSSLATQAAVRLVHHLMPHVLGSMEIDALQRLAKHPADRSGRDPE